MGTACGKEAVPWWKGCTNHCQAPSKRLIQLRAGCKTRENPHHILGSASCILWAFLGSRTPIFVLYSALHHGPRRRNSPGCAWSGDGGGKMGHQALGEHKPHQTNPFVPSSCVRPSRGLLWVEAAEVSLGSQLQQLPVFNASHALFYYTSNPLCLQSRKSCQRPLIQTEFNLSNSIYSGRAAKSIY